MLTERAFTFNLKAAVKGRKVEKTTQDERAGDSQTAWVEEDFIQGGGGRGWREKPSSTYYLYIHADTVCVYVPVYASLSLSRSLP